jgi:predicted DNA-binding transcriptional regulator AlpA
MAVHCASIENNDDQASHAAHGPKGLYFPMEGRSYPIFLPDEAMVEIKQFMPLLPFEKSCWWAGVKTGRFPQGKRLGHNKTAWTVGQIRQVLHELAK